MKWAEDSHSAVFALDDKHYVISPSAKSRAAVGRWEERNLSWVNGRGHKVR